VQCCAGLLSAAPCIHSAVHLLLSQPSRTQHGKPVLIDPLPRILNWEPIRSLKFHTARDYHISLATIHSLPFIRYHPHYQPTTPYQRGCPAQRDD
jgi:hypothetical protein